MLATKFKVTIAMEVEDADNNVPADSEALTKSIKKAVENIGFGTITAVVEVERTGRTGVTPTVSRELRELRTLGEKSLRPEER